MMVIDSAVGLAYDGGVKEVTRALRFNELTSHA